MLQLGALREALGRAQRVDRRLQRAPGMGRRARLGVDHLEAPARAQVDPVVVVYDTQSELMDHHSDAFNSALWTFVWSVAGEVLRVPAPPSPPEPAQEPSLSPPPPSEPTPSVAEDPAPALESATEGPSSPPT